MNIAVIGDGAVGRLITGLLYLGHFPVKLISRKKIAESNYFLRFPDNKTKEINAEIRQDIDFVPDIVFITVKIFDLVNVCNRFNAVLKNTPLILVQNGVRAADTVFRELQNICLLQCILLFNVICDTSFNVRWVSGKYMVVGKVFLNCHYSFAKITRFLSRYLNITSTKDIRAKMWSKLLMNCFYNSMNVLTGQDLYSCMHNKFLRNLSILLVKECLHLFKKNRIRFCPLPNLPKLFIYALYYLPHFILSVFLKFKFNKKYKALQSSSLQSLLKNKKTEIDYLNGEIVVLAKNIGMKNSINQMIVELVKKQEKSGFFYSVAQLKKLLLF